MEREWRDLPGVQRADVYKKGILAATLTRSSGGIEFRYDSAYLSAGAAPVATTLPLSEDVVVTVAGAVPAFFAGLLPEGRRLTAVRRVVKTSADDELSLLLAVGADVVGDVAVLPEGDQPRPVTPAVGIEADSEVSFAEVFSRSVGEAPDRVGIPGVQDKVSARMITLPIQRAGRQCILKLNPPEFPGLVENEAFFLSAARVSGLDVVDGQMIHDSLGQAGLLVYRFDRVDVDGRVDALAAEDACQAMGRYPADKYAVTSEQVTLRLMDMARSPQVAARDLLRQFAFAYLTCNGDAHAKNFSLLEDSTGGWKIAPAYDLPSSHPYGDYTLALSIGGRRRENVTRRVFVEFGRELGLPERAALRVVDDLCDRVDLWIEDLHLLPFDTKRITKLRRAIEYRRRQLAPR